MNIANTDSYYLYRYTWTRNDLDFVPAGSDDKIVQQQGEGTLTFNFPEKQHEGFYKCFATNDFGTAVSGTVQLIFAGRLCFDRVNEQHDEI